MILISSCNKAMPCSKLRCTNVRRTCKSNFNYSEHRFRPVSEYETRRHSETLRKKCCSHSHTGRKNGVILT